MERRIGHLFGAMLAAATFAHAYALHAHSSALKKTGAPNYSHYTGVCFRRIAGLNAKGELDDWYEFNLVRSSGDVERDISRMRTFKDARILNPHLPENRWASAWLGDRSFNGIDGPDCSMLPKLK